jgi:hypothetical protein
MYDVPREQYASVIRELIRHENDVTNHRIMWLLVMQGLLVNAYVGVREDAEAANGLAVAGILVTLSAFVMLYKSYQARGYLHFLGSEAKRGEIARGIPGTRWLAEKENQTLAQKRLDLPLA